MTAPSTPTPKRRLRVMLSAVAGALLAALIVPPLARNLEHAPLDASARRQAPGQFLTLSHGIVHVRMAGPEQGRPVILVHGFSVPNYVFDQTSADLAASGFRVIRFDLYGRGWSDRPEVDYDRELFANQLLELMDTLRIPKADLLGLSMGGAIVGRFAAEHPERVRSLALVAPLTEPQDISVMAWPGVGEWLMRTWYLPKLAGSQLEDFPHPERVPGWAERFQPQMRYDGFGRAILSTMRHVIPESSLPDFQKVGKAGLPVLLVWGELDATVPYAQHAAVQRAIPQAQFISLPATGHLPVVEEPALTDPQLAAFFKRN
ncbi:Lipase 3 [Massilia sp. Bi118]|uniref:alpha/beta fold hydrolase n=1 Tax=Massilia sp. Bi118 TaxID=2822346 RepID=UPI001D82A02A|nr:alpha/beta fold hydrolase [Massilia sp. Bi118]CAH0209772.1 Lipase 3 [Massilia sp. Bi118]